MAKVMLLPNKKMPHQRFNLIVFKKSQMAPPRRDGYATGP